MRILHRFLAALVAACVVSGAVHAQATAMAPVKLLTTASTSSAQIIWPGGAGVFVVAGTWNGATVTLQFLGPDGTTLITAGTATTLTANGAGVFYLPRGLIQATITSAGGSTSLTATASALPTFIG